jgi:hypothetical protein
MMMQSPQILYALARQNERIDPPRTVIERESDDVPVHRPDHAAAARPVWFWQLLFGRRETVAS